MSELPAKDLFRFINWCEPLVCDVIRTAYEDLLADDETAVRDLSLAHRTYFRRLLSDDKRLCKALHSSLVRAHSKKRLPASAIERISNAVADELRNVAVDRFVHSRVGLIELLKILENIRLRIFADAMLAKDVLPAHG